MTDLRSALREACDLAASYADDAREYGEPSPRIAELRALADKAPDPIAAVLAAPPSAVTESWLAEKVADLTEEFKSGHRDSLRRNHDAPGWPAYQTAEAAWRAALKAFDAEIEEA